LTPPLPHVDGVEHRFVEANGLRVHLAEAGAGDPVILLHGWPQHWASWRHVIPLLAHDYRLICPDLRGFGWTDAPAAGYEKERLADDLLALLDVLALERVRVVGHDWGGWVAFLAALRAPERFERVLVLNIPPPWPRITLANALGSWRFWYQWVLASGLGGVLLRRYPRLVGRAIVFGASRPQAWTREDLDNFGEVLSEPRRARASVLLYRTFLQREQLAVLRGRYRGSDLHVRTHLLFGVDDQAISTSLLRGVDRGVEALTVELVPNCAHFIAEERPELVAERARTLFG